MEDKRQLTMTLDLTKKLPEIPGLNPGYELVSAAGLSYVKTKAMWEKLIDISFKEHYDYSLITDDDTCSPDRVFFVLCNGEPAATSTARFITPEQGGVHMVGADPAYSGNHAGINAVYATVKILQDMGCKTAILRTDDFRLPAVKIYETLGFTPDLIDQSMIDRWDKVHENIKNYRK